MVRFFVTLFSQTAHKLSSDFCYCKNTSPTLVRFTTEGELHGVNKFVYGVNSLGNSQTRVCQGQPKKEVQNCTSFFMSNPQEFDYNSSKASYNVALATIQIIYANLNDSELKFAL